jgi:xylulokinase
VRERFGLTWAAFSEALARTPPGNGGRVLLPWFEPEITPSVARPGERWYGPRADDAAAWVRAVVEGQMMAMALHSRWMGGAFRTIHATGGAAVNARILQVMADVFGAEVRRFEVGNSAALGAALRAFHADRLADGRPVPWDDVVRGLAEPLPDSRITPDPARHAMYRDLTSHYAECEADALRRS